MKKTQLLSLFVILTAIFNAGISYSTRPGPTQEDDGEDARCSTVVICAKEDKGSAKPESPTEISLFPRTVLGVTDNPEDYDLLHNLFKGFNPETEDERQAIDSALNRLSYDILRPILVGGPDAMGLQNPAAIQEYITRQLLSQVIETTIDASKASIADTAQIQSIADQLMDAISPRQVQVPARPPSTTFAGWLMDKYQSITATIYDYTAGSLARMPARLMSVYLTDVKGANIGQQLRMTMAGFADQLEIARPYFIRSWERKLEINAANARVLELELARQEDVLTAVIGSKPLRQQIQEAESAIRSTQDTKAEELEMVDAYRAAARAKRAAAVALDNAIKEADRRAKVRSGNGILGRIIYAISKIRRMIIDPSDVAAARKTFNKTTKNVVAIQEQAEEKKQARLIKLNRKLRTLKEKRPQVRAIEARKSEIRGEISELVRKKTAIERTIADFKRTRVLAGIPDMDRHIMAKVNPALDITLKQDRFYYSALSALGHEKTPAINALIGQSSAKIGARITAEIQEAAAFAANKISFQNTQVTEELRTARRDIQRLTETKDTLHEAIELLVQINVFTNYGMPIPTAPTQAEEIYEGVQRTLPVTKVVTQRLYQTAEYIRNIGKAVIPALTTTGLAYTSLLIVDSMLWGTLGTEVGVLGTLDALRTGIMASPADALGITPTLLYSAMPVLGSIISYSATVFETKNIAAKTAVAGTPLAALWFAPILAPAVTATSLVTLMDWATATRVATAGKHFVSGAAVSIKSNFTALLERLPSL